MHICYYSKGLLVKHMLPSGPLRVEDVRRVLSNLVSRHGLSNLCIDFEGELIPVCFEHELDFISKCAAAYHNNSVQDVTHVSPIHTRRMI